MVYRNILLAVILVSLFFETTVISFPLVFIFSVLAFIIFPDFLTILFAISSSIILDMLRISPIGASAFYLILVFVLVELLRHAYEIKEYKFVLVFLLISSYIFSRIFGYGPSIALYVLLYGGLGIVIYALNKRLKWL